MNTLLCMPNLPDTSLQAEAARFALLRRLAPTIRHHLVGELQPIGMVTSMLDRRLQGDAPNLTHLRENSAALGKLSRTAASSCMNLMSWRVPKNGALTWLDVAALAQAESVDFTPSTDAVDLRFSAITNTYGLES